MEGGVKGTDITQEQLDSAEHFVRDRQATGPKPQTDQRVSLCFDELVRLVAWYGALRYEAGRNGIASLEKPGYFVKKTA